MSNFGQVTPEMTALLRRSGSERYEEAIAGMQEFAKAIETPLRKGVQSGNILFNIYTTEVFQPGASVEYPLDFLAPGTEKDFTAYTIPRHGRLPERTIEGDYVMVPTYSVGNTIDWLLKYARDARWGVIKRAMQVFEAGFVKKMNDDGWHTLLSAGVDRNIVVYDADAAAGQFTKRLVSLMKTVMRRNGGGNSTSQNRRKLTDIYLSPEGVEDIRNWGADQLSELDRTKVYNSEDGTLNRIFSVNLHDLDELGEGQEYQSFFSQQLTGALASGDVELVVGLDQSKNDSFMMPIREELKVFEDPTFHRQQRQSFYGWQEHGFACLDGRNILLGSY